ncbi:unnamed protein product [Linum trigynum]|uniref:Uncharacterized protein n=1 Tax=Linum trigynum TaxID=586398 RepID=A0AAV2F4F4_9ROSI
MKKKITWRRRRRLEQRRERAWEVGGGNSERDWNSGDDGSLGLRRERRPLNGAGGGGVWLAGASGQQEVRVGM